MPDNYRAPLRVSLEDRVLSERILLMGHRSIVSAMSSPIAAAILYLIARAEGVADTAQFSLWFGLLLIGVACCLHQTLPLRNGNRPAEDPRHWLRRYTVNTFILGTAWGCSVWMLLSIPSQIMTFMLYIVLCGVCAVVVIMQSLFWPCTTSFLLGALLQVQLKAIFAGSTLENYIAICSAIYVFMLSLYCALINRQIIHGVMAGIQAQLLTEDLSVANLRTEQALNALQTEHDQLQQALGTIRQMAEQDDLTKLTNRRAIMARLQACQQRFASGKGHAPTLVMFDIDHFKQINDEFGHDTGDQVLTGLAQRLGPALCHGETLARIGGEEFIILLEQQAPDTATVRAGQLLKLLGATPLLTSPRNIVVTASFGVATLQAGENVNQWLKRTDEAMYAAKRGGRNQLVRA